MAEGRILKSKASRDPQLAQLSYPSLILYVLSIPHLDVEGRMVGLPASVRGLVVPEIARTRPRDWTDQHVANYIFEWASTVDRDGCLDPLVLWYATAGENVLEFTGFGKNQSLRRDRESPSRLPAPPPDASEQAQTVLADLALSTHSGSEQEVELELALPAGFSVARAREATEARTGLLVSQEIQTSLDAAKRLTTLRDFGDAPAGSSALTPDDFELARIFSQLRGADDGTMHMLKVWRRKGCGERDFATAMESLRSRRQSGRKTGNEARYFCGVLSNLLREREEAVA